MKSRGIQGRVNQVAIGRVDGMDNGYNTESNHYHLSNVDGGYVAIVTWFPAMPATR